METEAAWLAAHPEPVRLSVQPAAGETLELPPLPPSTSVAAVKERIAAALGVAVGRQKLMTLGGLVMRSGATLAYYNLADGDVLALAAKGRAGKGGGGGGGGGGGAA